MLHPLAAKLTVFRWQLLEGHDLNLYFMTTRLNPPPWAMYIKPSDILYIIVTTSSSCHCVSLYVYQLKKWILFFLMIPAPGVNSKIWDICLLLFLLTLGLLKCHVSLWGKSFVLLKNGEICLYVGWGLGTG